MKECLYLFQVMVLVFAASLVRAQTPVVTSMTSTSSTAQAKLDVASTSIETSIFAVKNFRERNEFLKKIAWGTEANKDLWVKIGEQRFEDIKNFKQQVSAKNLLVQIVAVGADKKMVRFKKANTNDDYVVRPLAEVAIIIGKEIAEKYPDAEYVVMSVGGMVFRSGPEIKPGETTQFFQVTTGGTTALSNLVGLYLPGASLLIPLDNHVQLGAMIVAEVRQVGELKGKVVFAKRLKLNSTDYINAVDAAKMAVESAADINGRRLDFYGLEMAAQFWEAYAAGGQSIEVGIAK